MKREELEDYILTVEQIEDMKYHQRLSVKTFSKQHAVFSYAPDSPFWDGIEVLSRLIDRMGVNKGTEEFFRAAAVESPERYIKAVQFSNTYRAIVDYLYNPLFDVVQGCSDDTYSDVLDYFPLLGAQMVNAALAGELPKVNYKEFYNGENYVGMRLEDARDKYFKTYARKVLERMDDEEYEKRKAEKKTAQNW